MEWKIINFGEKMFMRESEYIMEMFQKEARGFMIMFWMKQRSGNTPNLEFSKLFSDYQ